MNMRSLKFAIAAALSIAAAPALAQSNPNLQNRQVPTAVQWNSYFSSKQDVLGYVPLNTTGGVMSGRLITAAPGASTSGLNLTPGTTPASPVNGDLWVTSSGFFAQVGGVTIGPIGGATSSSFAGTSPITVSFPAGIVTYACATCLTLTGTQTATNKTLTAPTINGGTHTAITSFGIRSTGSGAFDMTIANAETLTAGRSLTITLNDASRGLNLNGNLTVVGALQTPAVVQGDVWYGSALGVISALAKDTNATRYLSNQGTSNNPSWSQVNLANGVIGNLSVNNLNSGTLASATTWWRGDGTWATPAGGGNVTNSGTPTANQTAVWVNSTSAKGIGPGTLGQQWTSNGAGVDPSFTSGGWALLNTLTATASATLADTTSLTASYNEYEIVFQNILPATNNAQCQFQVNSGGVQTTSYSSPGIVFAGSASSVATSTTFIGCSNIGSGDVGNTSGGVSGSFRVSTPSSAAVIKGWVGNFTYLSSGGTSSLGVNTAGQWLGGTGAVTGFQMKFSSGNITSGVIKVYGRL